MACPRLGRRVWIFYQNRREENFVGDGTVLVDAEEVRFERNYGNVASMGR